MCELQGLRGTCPGDVFQLLSHSMPLQEDGLLPENVCLLWKQDANRHRSVPYISKTHNVLLLSFSCHLSESHDIHQFCSPLQHYMHS